MYIPKSKYSEPKHSRGDFLFSKDGTPYVGWYVKTYNDIYLSGKEPSNSSTVLELVDEEPDKAKPKFISDTILPEVEDYNKGYFTRYYLQDRRNLKIIQVNQQKYFYFTKETYIKGIELKWVIRGPAQDVIKPPYLYQGAITRNKQTIDTYSNMMTGLKDYILDYKEFVE